MLKYLQILKIIKKKMRKIGIFIMTIIGLIFVFFVFKSYQTKKDLNNLMTNSGITAEEKDSLINNRNKKDIDARIETLKKKIKLKWLISKANMYYNENEYMIALIEYQKVLKDIPNDEEINTKIWDIYYKIHKYKKANEHYQKIKNSHFLDKKKAIFSLINDKWVNQENIEYLNQEIDSFNITDEEKFYYKNSISCIIDYSLCRKNFQDYFENNEIKTEEMEIMKKSFKAFQNFKDNDLYYKAAFVTGWFFQNAFYYVTLKTSENILGQKNDYKPVIRMAAKSSYEIWDYISAKKYLNQIRETDYNDPEVSYFLARIYEKLNDKIPALVNYQKALKDWYKDIIDIRRRMIFIYFETKDNKKMLKEFDNLLIINSDKLNENDYKLAIYYNILENNFEKAEQYAKKAIEIFKNSEVFYWYLALIILQKENLDEIDLKTIKENIEKSKKISNKNPLILMIEWIYEAKLKNYNVSIIKLKSAYSMDKSWEYKEIINLWLEQINLEKNLNNSNN